MLDFVIKLSPSKDLTLGVTYDSILVVVDYLIEYGIMLLYREKLDAKQLAYTFLRDVVANHEMPEELISDRDKLFISKFWTSPIGLLGVNYRLSTIYYPQSNEKTEKLTQIIK